MNHSLVSVSVKTASMRGLLDESAQTSSRGCGRQRTCRDMTCERQTMFVY
jgi:hypothetical protein